MDDSVAGVVLAAGAGRRLAPLTSLRPKALCPVGNRPLVDHALERVRTVAGSVAVNLHHGAEQLADHLPVDVHRSVEAPVALGTAGALGALGPWIDGRDVVVTNADAWFGPGLDVVDALAGWDRERIRLLCIEDPARGDFGPLRYCGIALLPARMVTGLAPVPSGLYEVSWRTERERGRLDLVRIDVPFVDCGTPADYLAANLAWSGGASVVDPGAEVATGAVLDRCVVWRDARVDSAERLTDAVRAPGMTVLVR